MQHNTGGQTKIILSAIKEAGLQVVSLHTPCEEWNKLVIHSATHRLCQRGIRSTVVRNRNVARPDQVMSKGADLSNRDRDAWPKKKSVLPCVQAKREAIYTWAGEKG